MQRVLVNVKLCMYTFFSHFLTFLKLVFKDTINFYIQVCVFNVRFEVLMAIRMFKEGCLLGCSIMWSDRH
jgi:hypothetical protein